MLEKAFAEIKENGTQAVLVVPDPLFNPPKLKVVELSLRYGLASIHSYADWARAGGLLSYGEGLAYFLRRSAYFVDKILKGESPSNLPIELPANFKLVVNIKTAAAIGLMVPDSIFARADEVIE